MTTGLPDVKWIVAKITTSITYPQRRFCTRRLQSHAEKGKRKWKVIDETTLYKELQTSLPQLKRPRTKAALDGYVEAVMEALPTTIEASIPSKVPSPRIARWPRNIQNQSPTPTPVIKNTSQVANTPEKAALFIKTSLTTFPTAYLEDIDNAFLPLLDVSGALDSASHRRLLHNLNKLRIDEKTSKWIASFIRLQEGKISLAGLRSPLSPSLYPFYNADLLDSCRENGDTTTTTTTTTTGFIDDAAILALQKAFQKAETQATIDASVFADENSQLTHFARAKSRNNAHTRVESQWEEAMHKKICEYPRLMTRGMRTIYKRVATPQMMYACLWWSNGGWGEKGYTKRTLQRLQSLLVKAARRTSGAEQLKHIQRYVAPLWKQGPRIYIVESVKQAEKGHRRCLQQNPNAVHIDTNSSGIGGESGATAVCSTTSQTHESHMGDGSTSTVCA
ncbi:retrotransposon reverse transcriptase-like protein [Colletotrichum incanum]|nr:retrotransposon reverse transcriptase-like protein [Colletotrichum incanum]